MAFATTSSTSFHPLPSAFFPLRARAQPSSVNFRRSFAPISAVHTAADSPLSTITLDPLNSASFYEVLGIQDWATRREIKDAYRRLARVLHPDAAASDGQKDATSAANEFIRVHEAYATLSDPSKRADYDRMLLFKRRRIRYSPNQAVSTAKYATTSYTGFSGYTRRTWETDQCW